VKHTQTRLYAVWSYLHTLQAKDTDEVKVQSKQIEVMYKERKSYIQVYIARKSAVVLLFSYSSNAWGTKRKPIKFYSTWKGRFACLLLKNWRINYLSMLWREKSHLILWWKQGDSTLFVSAADATILGRGCFVMFSRLTFMYTNSPSCVNAIYVYTDWVGWGYLELKTFLFP